MKHLSKALLLAASTFTLFGCQSPATSTPTTSTTPTTSNSTATAPATSASNTVRTLNNVTCNNQSVNVNLSTGGIVQKGSLKGYNYCEYQIALKAGQHLNVDFNSPAIGANVIVFDRTDLAPTALTEDGYTASQDEVLPVRVLLTRNEARTGNEHPFTVKFTAQ
ncbi:hypothetical protein [Psychrobacter pygoscelis]|uniref:hypothetical protein n=1 Tax=Psychrobacter pygoscelis TaxID=2488563 RepID=UPI00103F196A|nr:hypothetical protein [Psychrobacter pygoscelis]